MLGLGLFRVFQDVRLVLVPALLVLAHAAASCILVYTNQVCRLVYTNQVLTQTDSSSTPTRRVCRRTHTTHTHTHCVLVYTNQVPSV